MSTMSSGQSPAFMGDPKWNSLAMAAAKLFEQEDYIGAWLVYELLQQWTPQFEHHIQTVREELSQKGEGGVELASKTTIHSDKATELQKRLRVAHVVSALGDERLVNGVYSQIPTNKIPAELWLARANAIAVVRQKGWWGKWLTRVNRYLEAYALPPVALRSKPLRTGDSLYMNLESANMMPVTGPLVSIHMSCFNAEATIELAIRSLQAQSYHNFELLIFDDCSSDGSAQIVRRLAKQDPRIKFVANERNQGAYVNRNQALQQAIGEFFTVHDSDDFALPHRLAWAVQHLQSNPAHVAVIGQWLRVNEQSRFVFKSGWGGVYQHIAVATLMLRTKQALENVGYWDSVRFAADTEYFERLKLVYGEQNVPVISMPVALALSHSNSLTNHPEHGIDVNNKEGWSPARSEYARAWKRWHKESVLAAGKDSDKTQKLKKFLYIPFPVQLRPFNVPDVLLSKPVAPSVAIAPATSTDCAQKLITPISSGNALWRNGDLNNALREYQKIASDSPLFQYVQFNIKMIERSLRLAQHQWPKNSNQ
ncbi:TPA: glycosyltransferase family 2 protein [Aeromonas sobria]|nr:glycosyltransferase family 2 protein [Aeromonas sobria]